MTFRITVNRDDYADNPLEDVNDPFKNLTVEQIEKIHHIHVLYFDRKGRRSEKVYKPKTGNFVGNKDKFYDILSKMKLELLLIDFNPSSHRETREHEERNTIHF